jgi:hypothetical protein
MKRLGVVTFVDGVDDLIDEAIESDKAFKRLAASTFVSRRAAECSRNSSGSIEKLIE